MSSDAFGYDSGLPEDIREIFMWLCQDVASLQNKWSFYLELFSSQENTALLSDLAQSSFHIIEESLRDDLTMAIYRMSDPSQSRGKDNRRKDNLSLETLALRCGAIDSVTDLLEDFKKACKPVRQYRNKRVGHNDLNTTIKPHDNPLPGIGRSQIDRILELASKILNIVYQNFVDGELFFASIQIGGADALMYWLKMAKEYQAQKKLALRSSAA